MAVYMGGCSLIWGSTHADWWERCLFAFCPVVESLGYRYLGVMQLEWIDPPWNKALCFEAAFCPMRLGIRYEPSTHDLLPGEIKFILGFESAPWAWLRGGALNVRRRPRSEVVSIVGALQEKGYAVRLGESDAL